MSGLFGGKPPKPKPPEPPPAPVTVNDDLIDQQTRTGLLRRKGRASTMLAATPDRMAAMAKKALGQ